MHICTCMLCKSKPTVMKRLCLRTAYYSDVLASLDMQPAPLYCNIKNQECSLLEIGIIGMAQAGKGGGGGGGG